MTCHADTCEFWTGRDCACTTELRELAAEYREISRGMRDTAALAGPEPADLTPEEQRQHAVDIEDDRVAEAGWER